MVLLEKLFLYFSQNLVSNLFFSATIKLFMNQSEFDIPPAGYQTPSYSLVHLQSTGQLEGYEH